MALPILDRLLTIVVTATVTSAAWIVAGGLGLLPDLSHRSGASRPAAQGSVGPGPSASIAATAAPAFRAMPGGLIIPVVGVKPEGLVDTFTAARAGGLRVHDAIDIMAAAGTPVLAAATGKVEKLFLSKDGGNTVYVRSQDGRTIYYYAHLQDYQPGLSEGQVVRQGDQLGRVGWTGNANPAAPHLHFAIFATSPTARWWDSGTALNPYPLLLHHTAPTNLDDR